MTFSQPFRHYPDSVGFVKYIIAKKVTKESTVCRFDGVFAEATSLCLRRTAHFLCAVKVGADLSKAVASQSKIDADADPFRARRAGTDQARIGELRQHRARVTDDAEVRIAAIEQILH